MRYRRRPTLLILCVIAGLLFLNYLRQHLGPFFDVQLYHFRWRFHSWLYAIGLAGLLTKEPLIQVVNAHTLDIVFEMRHDPARFVSTSVVESPASVQYRISGTDAESTVVASMVQDEEGETFVFRARIADRAITGAAFTYHIALGRWRSRTFATHYLHADDEGTIHLGVVGDNQFAAVRFSKVLTRLRAVSSSSSSSSSAVVSTKLDGFIHVGDAVQDATSARAWSTDFWGPVARQGMLDRPWIMLHGNHDSPSPYTSQPRGGGVSTTSGSTRPQHQQQLGYGSVHLAAADTFLVVLDANADSELQDRYLQATLSSESAQAAGRRVVLVHIPPFVEFWDPVPWRGGEKLWGAFVRAKWVPIFLAQHVDLVLSGHQHNYQRATRAGVTYVIAGGAGGTLDRERVEDYALRDGVTVIDHHFGILSLSKRAGIHWRMFLEDGTLADQVVI